MTERRTVLVVDGDPDARLLYRVHLEFDGYDVIEAADGQAALEQVRLGRPDVVLLGVMLPTMDGWKVLEVLKADEHTRNVPVVLLTSGSDEQEQIRGVAQGAADHIIGPFSPRTLSQVLLDALATGPRDEEERRRQTMEKLRLLHNG